MTKMRKTPAVPDSETPLTRRQGRRGRGRRRIILLLFLFVALIALLPTIVVKTPLRNVLLARLIPADAVKASIGELSFGWLTPLAANAISIHDPAGGELLTVESLRLDRSLWSLLTRRGDLGTLEVARPALRIDARADGSNLEDVLRTIAAEYPAAAPSAEDQGRTGAAVTLTVRVLEGSVLIDDASAKRQWRASGVNLQLAAKGADAPIELSVDGNLEESQPAAPVGRFQARLAPAPAGVPPGRRQFSWQIDGAPLSALAPFLRRQVVEAELAGTLSGQGIATWTPSAASAGPLPADFATSGAWAIDRLDFGSPHLNGDRLRLSRVELPWKLAAQPSGLLPPGVVIEDLRLRCDVAHFAVQGSVASSLWNAPGAGGAPAAGGQDVELRGVVDLARLALMLPRLLRVREDTSVTSGTVELTARLQPGVGGDVFGGSLRTTQLAGTSAGRPLRWEEPIGATFAARHSAEGWRLDSLSCESDFLAFQASGSAEQFAASARFDLNRLGAQLGQFLDLNGVELAGSGEGQAGWKWTGDSRFSAQLAGKLTDLRIGSTGGAAWTESALELDASATGSTAGSPRRLSQVDAASLRIVAQGDELDLRLLQPVQVGYSSQPTAAGDTFPSSTEWPVKLRAVGGIARWLARVRPLVDTAGWRFDGQSDLGAEVLIAGGRIALRDAKLSIKDLEAANADWQIAEPRFELAGDASFDASTGTLVSQSAQLVTSTVSLATQGIRYRHDAAAGFQLAGASAFRADVARLANWRRRDAQSPATPPDFQPRGQLVGNVRFTEQAGHVFGELIAGGQDLALAQWVAASGNQPAGYRTIWQEPQLAIRGTTDYDRSADRIAVKQLQINSNTLSAQVDGQVDRLSSAADVSLTGTVKYDLAQLATALRPYLGSGVQLIGQEQARFAVAGALGQPLPAAAAIPANLSLTPQPSTLNAPHWSRRVRAQVELPWSGANVYGLPIGGGRVAAVLGDGVVRVDPLSLAVAEGTLTAAPTVRLDPPPRELALPAGPLLAGVRISPEISESMLKYIAPVLAGATQSEGRFSLSLAGAKVPLENAKQLDAGGQLTVHSVRVVPGEMAKQWIALVRQIESLIKTGGNPLGLSQSPSAATSQREITLLSIRDQQVNFRVVEGRVHHQNMEFEVENVVLRSQGWVGFDESISLTLTVPIQSRWIESQRLLAGLKGQSLQVPITGTLTRPRMDDRAVASLSAQLLQGAAGQAVGNELNRALDRLFKPKQNP